jgi:hypothetical protein
MHQRLPVFISFSSVFIGVHRWLEFFVLFSALSASSAMKLLFPKKPEEPFIPSNFNGPPITIRATP